MPRERGEALGLLKAEHPDDTSLERTLSELPGPVEHAVSFLARERRARVSCRLLMVLGTGAERIGLGRLSEQSAKMARRIQILCGFRQQLHQMRTVAVAATPPQVSSSTKSGS